MDPMIIDPATGLPGYIVLDPDDQAIAAQMATAQMMAEGDPETEPGEPLVTPPPRDPDEEDDDAPEEPAENEEPEDASAETPDDDVVEGPKDDDANDLDNEPDAEGRKTHE